MPHEVLLSHRCGMFFPSLSLSLSFFPLALSPGFPIFSTHAASHFSVSNIDKLVVGPRSKAIFPLSLSLTVCFYITCQDMPKELQPKFVLDVETSELYIQTGLQDGVIQVGQLSNETLPL